MLNALRIAALTLLLAALGAPQQPPNIVLILADDLGSGQIGANGGKAYRTPHIDRLATEGMRCTSAYSPAAVCSPTRAALMSGRYPARLHVTDHTKGSNPRDQLLLQPEWHKRLDLEVTTIAEIFRRNGYRTAHFGK